MSDKESITIAGRAVTFRQRLPLRDGDELTERLAGVKAGKLSSFVPVLQLMVESWEFPGDPKDSESYQELDVLSEAMPLVQAFEKFLMARAQALADTKN